MSELVRLEGFHAVKHALRFGAAVHRLVTPDLEAVDRLRLELAPDLDLEAAGVAVVDDETWAELAPRGLPSPLLGWAPRPGWTPDDLDRRDAPVVVLEHPRHLGNLGAVVRVAAAADAAGVLVAGDADPWHPTVVRAAAGLHWALPVLPVTDVRAALALTGVVGRPVVALDERGEDLHEHGLPRGAVLLLGTERHGLSTTARDAATGTVAIPMRPGVASLNLATAAAVALYATGR